jgi:hypothetical protein
MALYKYANVLIPSTNSMFDAIHTPGTPTPTSGIYGCTGCGKEVASNAPNPLPSQNHHQHGPSQGLIRWRLYVEAQ